MTSSPIPDPANNASVHTTPQLVPPMRAGDGSMWRVLELGEMQLRADGRIKQLQCTLASIPGADAQNAVTELIEALRLTVEYVGTATLPPIEGWSWYDALRKYHPDLAQSFVEHYRRPALFQSEAPRLLSAEDYLRATARACGVNEDRAVAQASLRSPDSLSSPDDEDAAEAELCDCFEPPGGLHRANCAFTQARVRQARQTEPTAGPEDPPDLPDLRFDEGVLRSRVVDGDGVEHCPRCDAPESPRGYRRNYTNRAYDECEHRWHRRIGWRWRWGRRADAPRTDDEPLDDQIRNYGGPP